jgi:hypothetical protein
VGLINQAPTQDKSSPYNIRARGVGLINQAPTQDNSSSCSNIGIGFLKKVACPFFGPLCKMNQVPTQDKSNPCNKNFWLAISYYFKDSKKCCRGTL